MNIRGRCKSCGRSLKLRNGIIPFHKKVDSNGGPGAMKRCAGTGSFIPIEKRDFRTDRQPDSEGSTT